MPPEPQILPTADSVTNTVTELAKKSRFAKLLDLLGMGNEPPKPAPSPLMNYMPVPKPALPPGLSPEVARALEPSLLAHGLNLKTSSERGMNSGMGSGSSSSQNSTASMQKMTKKRNIATTTPETTAGPKASETPASVHPKADISPFGPLASMKNNARPPKVPGTKDARDFDSTSMSKNLARNSTTSTGPMLSSQVSPINATGTGTGTMVNDVSETKVGSFDSFVMEKLGFLDPSNANAMGMSLPGFLATGLSAYAGSQLGGGLDSLLAKQQAGSRLGPVSEILTGGKSNPADDLLRKNHANSMLKELNLKQMAGIPNEAVGAMRAAKLKDTLAKRLAKQRSPLLKSLGLLAGASLPFMVSSQQGTLYPQDPYMAMNMGMM